MHTVPKVQFCVEIHSDSFKHLNFRAILEHVERQKKGIFKPNQFLARKFRLSSFQFVTNCPCGPSLKVIFSLVE